MSITYDEYLRRVPKVELHCHFNGTLRAETFADLARKHDIALPKADASRLYDYETIYEFLEILSLVSRTLIDREDFARAAHDAKRISAVADGTWKSGFYYGSMADGFLSLAPYGPSVTAETKAKIAAKEAEMKAGSFFVFQGPIVDQSGKVQIAAGKKATIDQLYSIDYFVKGIEGSAKG